MSMITAELIYKIIRVDNVSKIKKDNIIELNKNNWNMTKLTKEMKIEPKKEIKKEIKIEPKKELKKEIKKEIKEKSKNDINICLIVGDMKNTSLYDNIEFDKNEINAVVNAANGSLRANGAGTNLALTEAVGGSKIWNELKYNTIRELKRTLGMSNYLFGKDEMLDVGELVYVNMRRTLKEDDQTEFIKNYFTFMIQIYAPTIDEYFTADNNLVGKKFGTKITISDATTIIKQSIMDLIRISNEQGIQNIVLPTIGAGIFASRQTEETKNLLRQSIIDGIKESKNDTIKNIFIIIYKRDGDEGKHIEYYNKQGIKECNKATKSKIESKKEHKKEPIKSKNIRLEGDRWWTKEGTEEQILRARSVILKGELKDLYDEITKDEIKGPRNIPHVELITPDELKELNKLSKEKHGKFKNNLFNELNKCTIDVININNWQRLTTNAFGLLIKCNEKDLHMTFIYKSNMSKEDFFKLLSNINNILGIPWLKGDIDKWINNAFKHKV